MHDDDPATVVAAAGNGQPAHLAAKVLGPYTLVRLLGRGGMGAVWEAVDYRLGRHVALKVMVGDPDAGAVERFRREASHSARLRHPHIVGVHDIGSEGGRHYLVMDLVQGTTLSEALRAGTLTYRDKAGILVKVALAVQYAHEQGVIHRDLKPANVMLDSGGHGSRVGRATHVGRAATEGEDGGRREHADDTLTRRAMPATAAAIGEPLVMDFGLAKDTTADSSLSQTGQAMGTPSYMPPEQAEGRLDAVGPRSDVYSLGAILYDMLTGRPPFTGENVVQVLQAVVREDPISPRAIVAGVPRDLETICLRCLEKDPARRYASAGALGDDLRAWLSGDPISARPATPLERVARRVRKNPAAYAVATIAVAIMLCGTTAFMASLDGKRREAESNLASMKNAQRARDASEQLRAQLEAERQRSWNLVFSDDFQDPVASAANWNVTAEKGHFEFVGGELHAWGGRPMIAALRQTVVGDIRIEFDCRLESEYLNDVSCMMCTNNHPGRDVVAGYEFKYGGWDNSTNAIVRSGAVLARESAQSLTRHTTYHARAERVGGRLRYEINGRLVLSVEDPHPLTGHDRGGIALFGYQADTYWSHVRIYRFGQPATADLLELAERQLESDHPTTANDLFEEVLASTIDPARRARALAGIKRTEPEMALARDFPDMVGRLRSVWPKAEVQLKRGGIRVAISEQSISDLSPLAGLPVVELEASHNAIVDLSPLAGATATLRELQMGNNCVTDLSPLRGLSLAVLEFSRNKVTSLEPLSGMSTLRVLKFQGNDVTDLSPLRNIPLDTVDFEGCLVSDMSALAGMHLGGLNCSFNPVESLAPVVGMPLNYLDVSGTKVCSLEPVRGMGISNLILSGTGITDLEPLRGMPLSMLWCDQTLVTDISPLASSHLIYLSVTDGPLAAFAWTIAAPPATWLFSASSIPESELARAEAAWSALPATRSLTTACALYRALEARDGVALRAMAQPGHDHFFLDLRCLATFERADALCRELGGHLPVIGGPDDEAALKASRSNQINSLWLGLHVDATGPHWTTGEPLTVDRFGSAWSRLTPGVVNMVFEDSLSVWTTVSVRLVPLCVSEVIIEWDR